MASEIRVECPKCLLPLAGAKDHDTYAPGEGSHLCWGGAPCYARVCQMQAVAPEMVRLLERLLDLVSTRTVAWVGLDVEGCVLAKDAIDLLSRAKGDAR